jgi:small-conductance mechanosensitive channel
MIENMLGDGSSQGLAFSVMAAAGAWVTLAGFFWLLAWLHQRLQSRLTEWRKALREGPADSHTALKVATLVRIRAAEFFLFRAVTVVLGLILVPGAIAFTLRQFQSTSHLADPVVEAIREPFRLLRDGFFDYLPNLAFLVMWVIVIFYVIRLLGSITRWVSEGLLRIPGFHAEWAEPTYRIAVFLVIAFALVVAFPYLPGGKSPAFQGVSIFLGVLLSLGGGSLMGNVISGIVLTYTRAFRIGDRIQVGDHTGEVVEKSIFVTRVRTIRNEFVVIPNSTLLTKEVVNYSEARNHGGLVLGTTVTIGYEAPWREVSDLLLEAARRTPGVLADPAPFVRQTALNDHNVSYQLNVYTDRPNEVARVYSDLHAHIQDSFNEGGVEILSPAYSALRDGNHTTIPAHYLDREYRRPAFRVEP